MNMKNVVKRIIKELGLEKNVSYIEISENNNIFYQKIIDIRFNHHGDTATIILNAYNKNEFEKNTYEKTIREQILEQKYLFEEN